MRAAAFSSPAASMRFDLLAHPDWARRRDQKIVDAGPRHRPASSSLP